MQDSLSLRELLYLGTEQLEANGVENAREDALELINMVKKVDKTDMLLYPDMKFSKAEAEEVKKLFAKRAERIPLQHILGKACFYGHEFYVNENVLIPRFDTEIIVDEVLKYIKNERRGETLRILDMCTGSGCIAISLAMENEKLECLGVDISPQALEIAKKNKKRKNHHSRYRRPPTTTHSPTTATATATASPLSCTAHCATMDILVLSKSFITITITKSHSFHFILLHIFYLRMLLKSIHLIFIRLAIRLSHR